MKHVFIMDPLEGVKPWKDTSYFLMLAAFERGHEIYHVDQRDLFLDHNHLMAKARQVRVLDDHDQPFQTVQALELDMSCCHVVWLRTDPPFDRRYFYTTLLLDFLPRSVRIVNRPSGVRDWNEKFAALYFSELTPQTCVANDAQVIRRFAANFERVTIKPVDGFGGKGIFFYNPNSEPDSVLEEATRHGQHWVIAQEYLPAAKLGDKRILLLEGEPLGAILRVHAEGVELNNMDMGGQAVPCDLDEDDLAICAALKPGLHEKGIFFVGIDIIGGKLIEVNVTSPTGLQELTRFSGVPHHHDIIAATET